MARRLNKSQRKNARVFDRFRTETGIGITYEMGDKMRGIASLSTSPLANPICVYRQKCNGVCKRCYAAQYAKLRANLNRKLIANFNVLTTEILPVDAWPRVNKQAYPVFRIEAFGDTFNPLQAANYFNFARRNGHEPFAAWTKNYGHYAKAAELVGKPSNMQLIASSEGLNKEVDVTEMPLVDKTFTVYTAEYIIEHRLPPSFITCGGRHCKSCLRCYRPNANGEVEHVREILKSDRSKVERFWAREFGWTPDYT